MLIGEFHHNIDEKNRLVVPSKYRSELGNEVIITRGIDKCLYVYSLSNWDKLVSKLDTLLFTKKDSRTFMRSFFSGANNCEFDKAGRIVITAPQAEYANILKECVVIGVNDRLEIWAKDRFIEFTEENQDKLEEISERLFED